MKLIGKAEENMVLSVEILCNLQFVFSEVLTYKSARKIYYYNNYD